MQLKYRGIPYQASILDNSEEASARVGVNHRKMSDYEPSAKPSFRQPGDELIYRGVRYTR